MTEQTVPATPEVETTVTPVPEPEKRFRFTRKQVGYTLAATAAGAGLIWLKVKNSASKAQNEANDDSNPEQSETADSV